MKTLSLCSANFVFFLIIFVIFHVVIILSHPKKNKGVEVLEFLIRYILCLWNQMSEFFVSLDGSFSISWWIFFYLSMDFLISIKIRILNLYTLHNRFAKFCVMDTFLERPDFSKHLMNKFIYFLCVNWLNFLNFLISQVPLNMTGKKG